MTVPETYDATCRRANAQDSDEVLTSAVRAGGTDAFEHLWHRHEPAARAVARSIAPAARTEDLVSEAFTRVLKVLRKGRGPTSNFRAYLLTTLRSVNIDHARRYDMRVKAIGLGTDLEPIVGVTNDPDTFDALLALRAWASLGESDRVVLWSREVDGFSLAETALAASVTQNTVAMHACRARERLREAFLREHLQASTRIECRKHRHRLVAYSRSTLCDAKRACLQAHLAQCGACSVAMIEVIEVNRRLKAAVGRSTPMRQGPD